MLHFPNRFEIQTKTIWVENIRGRGVWNSPPLPGGIALPLALRLFLGRATASFLRRSFLAAEEWFRGANPDAFWLEERPTHGVFSEFMSQLEVLRLSGRFLPLLRYGAPVYLLNKRSQGVETRHIIAAHQRLKLALGAKRERWPLPFTDAK